MSSPSTTVRFSVADQKPLARKRVRTPGFVRAAVLGALTGVVVAALVAGWLRAYSVVPVGIEADALAAWVDRIGEPARPVDR